MLTAFSREDLDVGEKRLVDRRLEPDGVVNTSESSIFGRVDSRLEFGFCLSESLPNLSDKTVPGIDARRLPRGAPTSHLGAWPLSMA